MHACTHTERRRLQLNTNFCILAKGHTQNIMAFHLINYLKPYNYSILTVLKCEIKTLKRKKTSYFSLKWYREPHYMNMPEHQICIKKEMVSHKDSFKKQYLKNDFSIFPWELLMSLAASNGEPYFLFPWLPKLNALKLQNTSGRISEMGWSIQSIKLGSNNYITDFCGKQVDNLQTWPTPSISTVKSEMKRRMSSTRCKEQKRLLKIKLDIPR